MDKEPSKSKDWLKKNRHIVVGLRDVGEVFEPDQYRIFGSLVPAALGRPYRRINDIDLLVDGKVEKVVIKRLKAKGYKVAPVKGIGNIVGVIPLRFSKDPTYIDMFFGQTEKNGAWRYPLKLGFSLYMPPAAWRSYPQLEFGNIKFSGINLSAAYYVTMLLEKKTMSKYKTRNKDLKILAKYKDEEEIERIKRQKPGLWFRNIHLPAVDLLVTIGNITGILDQLLVE